MYGHKNDLVCLTRVTTDAQEKAGKHSRLGGVDFPSGLFKVENKEMAVSFPQKPEPLSQRIKVLAVCWCMVKLRYPSNPKFATASLELFQRYTDYLMGPRVWGMVSMDGQMRPVS